MQHSPKKIRALSAALTALEQKVKRFLKAEQQCQQRQDHAALKALKQQLQTAKRLRPLLQQAIQTLEEKIPPPSALDEEYEVVVELHKKAATKGTLENKRAYQDALNKFLATYASEPTTNQELWAAAADECSKELAASSASLARAENVKAQIDQLEEQEAAKVYYIVKGTDKNGQPWGRIDYVGAAWVMASEKTEKGNNNLPLEVHYFTYTDGAYQLQQKSNKLETSFDKQLMDAFQKSGLVSYEQYKNLGRDYEYTPSDAPINGKGGWYLTMNAPNPTDKVAKIIEVPDWDDFGFEKIYNQYKKDCANGLLTKTDAKVRKKQLQATLDQQQILIDELDEFHHEENDADQNTAILLDVWTKKRAELQRALREDLKEDCLATVPALPPCEDFEPIYQQHQELCARMALPKRVGDALKAQMAECLATGQQALDSIDAALEKYKGIPHWEADAELKALVTELEAQRAAQAPLVARQKTQLAGLPEECLKPLALEVYFARQSNKIRTKEGKQTIIKE